MDFKRGLRKLGGLVYSCRFLMAVFLCAFGLFFASDTYATEKISISIPSSVSATLLPFSADGNFASSSATISVTSSYYTGYVLGISAKTANSNALINQSDNTKTLPSITSAVSETNYMNDSYAVANNLNNTWGYKPSTLYNPNTGNNETNNNYLVAPTSTTNQVILAETNAANLTPNTYDITVGARATSETVMGAYENTFVITVVVNQIPYSITYHENTEDSVSGMPANVEGSTLADTVPIGTAPSRSGYMFLGWCDTTTTNDGKADLCSGNVYVAGSDYTIDYTAPNNSLNLYAMWGVPTLYDKVSFMNKGTQTLNDLKQTITTTNSGVYEYNASVFGTASDISNDYKIYYYRGILDSDYSSVSYGTGGDGVNYPNYVKLGNTCWRILRTTGSGGVKMMYNGLYSGGTTANSCANLQANASVANKAFGAKGASASAYWDRNANRAGYTFNNDASIQDVTTLTSVDIVFGGTSLNTTDSGVKAYLEDTWFSSANGISDYESILEPGAGYCNDRTAHNINGVLLTNVAPYSDSDGNIYFGVYFRTYRDSGKPTLSCPRGVVDTYTTTTTIDGVSSTNGGNGQLDKPVALISLDEAAFNGAGGNSTSFNSKAFLVSGSNITTLSPQRREKKSGSMTTFMGIISGSSSGGGGGARNSYNIRPVVSLQHETYTASGSGTAVDPWVIDAPNSGN